MRKQSEEIRKLLEENGWKIIEEDEYSLDWWAAEMWRVESVWSPRGFALWLTFLVDPQGPFEPKHENVWGIGVTFSYPTDWIEVQDKSFLIFGKEWRTKLPQFMSELSGLRQNAATNMIEKSDARTTRQFNKTFGR